MIGHELKILPEYFADVASGKKNFELRKFDRDYREGDEVRLLEWTPEDGYTGNNVSRIIKYVLSDCEQYGLMEGYCILGF